MKLNLAFILILILNIGFVLAKTDKIEGVVRNSSNNIPLSETLITLEKNGEIYDTKYTSKNGSFSFYRLDSGNYLMKIERNDFITETRKVLITFDENITHSFSIYLESSKPVIAKVHIKELPFKSDYEHFLINHQFNEYNTDSTMLFSSTSVCNWNEKHQILYIGVLHLKTNINGNVEILNNSKLLGAYEVLPDIIEPVAQENTSKGKKIISLLEKVAESATKVMSENPGIVLK